MESPSALLSLSEIELDAVYAGRHMAFSQPSSQSQIGKVSIGEIVVYASGNANVTIDVIGVNSVRGGGRGGGGHMAMMHHASGGHLQG